MKEFDLVKVIRQPDRMLADILGEKGYIASIEENGCVDFHSLGKFPGQGIIPMDCLELCSDQDLFSSYERERQDYDRRADRFERQNPLGEGYRLPKQKAVKLRKLDL